MSLVRRLFALASVLSLWAGGCADVDPMPSPGRPSPERILVSATIAERQGGPVSLIGLVGLQGAVPGAGWVELRQPFGEQRTLVRATADGTFAAVISGAAGDQLTVTFRQTEDGPASEPVDLTVGHYDGASAPSTPETNGSSDALGGSVKVTPPQVSAPDGQGRVHVQGSSLAPGEVAAVGNARTGEVVEATVPSSGNIDVQLVGATGDTLVLIIRNPQTGFTSEIASLSVPAP